MQVTIYSLVTIYIRVILVYGLNVLGPGTDEVESGLLLLVKLPEEAVALLEELILFRSSGSM